jgi:TrmH family RNA methyltransferase
MNAKHITSVQNALIKKVLRLRSSPTERRESGLMLVEGRDEIRLALQAGHEAEHLILAPDLAGSDTGVPAKAHTTVSARVFERIAYRENPDGWLAILPTPQADLGDMKLKANPLLLVLEGVEKPGNLGAALRSADAAGVDGLIVADARTDIYGPNVVRASRGTIFSVPTAIATSEAALNYLRQHGMGICAADPQALFPYTRQDMRGPTALVFGTESTGLSEIWLREADARVRIPMLGRVNSLNVSIAAALLMYEAVRQRGEASDLRG